MRTNCLDCLDRTNFSQAHISYEFMDKVLLLLLNNYQKENPHVKPCFDMESERGVINQCLQRMWNENGDKLSNQYAGTQSNISGVLEEGK